MVEKVHGLVPEQGSWSEAEFTYVSIAAADDAALDAAVKSAQEFATIVALYVDTGVAHMILGYAADADRLQTAGFTVGTGFNIA